MTAMRKREVRMSDDLWRWVDDISERFEYGDKRGAKSRFIRDLISDSIASWRHSPYTCQMADKFVVITKHGNMFCSSVHDLYLNSRLEGVSCVIQQSPEKQKAYLRDRPRSVSAAEYLRDKWILNYFVARQGGDLLDEKIDADGSSEKKSILSIQKEGITSIQREILFGLQSHVQWLGDDKGDLDSMVTPIPCPTRNLKISVIIDSDLYRAGEARNISLIFMSPEGTRFSDLSFINMLDSPPKFTSGRYPFDARSHPLVLQLLRSKFTSLQKSISLVLPRRIGGEPIVASKSDRELLGTLTFPKSFLFFRMEWATPHMSMIPCVEWKKPQR